MSVASFVFGRGYARLQDWFGTVDFDRARFDRRGSYSRAAPTDYNLWLARVLEIDIA
jgi:hypothetical protein